MKEHEYIKAAQEAAEAEKQAEVRVRIEVDTLERCIRAAGLSCVQPEEDTTGLIKAEAVKAETGEYGFRKRN